MSRRKADIVRNSPLVLFLLALLTLPQNASGVSCHCFKDRTFEPSRPASADPYILATTRNSLLAGAAGMDKGAVVRLRMTGATETSLWLTSYLSTRVRSTAEQIQKARDRTPSWPAAFQELKLDTAAMGETFQEAREKDDADGMARALADPVLDRTFQAGEHNLALLRGSGANIAESALSLYLSGIMGQPTESIWNQVRTGERTWGELLNAQGIRIDAVGDMIAAKVRNSAAVH